MPNAKKYGSSVTRLAEDDGATLHLHRYHLGVLQEVLGDDSTSGEDARGILTGDEASVLSSWVRAAKAMMVDFEMQPALAGRGTESSSPSLDNGNSAANQKHQPPAAEWDVLSSTEVSSTRRTSDRTYAKLELGSDLDAASLAVADTSNKKPRALRSK